MDDLRGSTQRGTRGVHKKESWLGQYFIPQDSNHSFQECHGKDMTAVGAGTRKASRGGFDFRSEYELTTKFIRL